MFTRETGNGIGRQTPPHRHTRVAAAHLTGRSVDTLKRWHKKGLMVPSDYMQAGKLKVWLYTDEDILRLRKVASSQRPGRKPKKPDSPGTAFITLLHAIPGETDLP